MSDGRCLFEMLEPSDLVELEARPIRMDLEGVVISGAWDSHGQLMDAWTDVIYPDLVPVLWAHKKSRLLGAGQIILSPRGYEILGIVALDPDASRFDHFILYQIERGELGSLSIGWLRHREHAQLFYQGQPIRQRESGIEITEVSLCADGADPHAKVTKLKRRIEQK